MRKNLPPLKSLVAFESVVRHGSVTKAASELLVTHGAVSKQIGLLEDWCGRPLFGRNRKTMLPTEEGVALAHSAKQALDIIEAAVEEFQLEEQVFALQVLVPSTFAMRWLIPRVWSFADTAKQISIQLRQTHSLENWLDLPFEVAIRTERKTPSHLTAVPFLTDDLVLAISPASRLARSLNAPCDLRDTGVLGASTRQGEAENWLKNAGLHGDNIKTTVFPHFYLALEAALAGMGPLVCPRITLGDLLSKGDLIELWPDLRTPGPTYVALYDKNAPYAAAARTFVDWLSCQCADAPHRLWESA